ncbi:phosphatidate cytidylyltransferase [Sulfitobacter sp. F26204]|uniref:phosphatidate cytidylyltransferase n=1 Tax=Sulfitobacter sp. F26204 TaxID=2996014 RepID=UPI00225E1781|nr:phosphatidate cytidylyltransferase [Sulfitobacter sp. F26204]MCX7559927.1 phosphatidate cytidylyltransferase [Sulfitobacter sp. F26204]
MKNTAQNWSDLKARVGAGAVMVAVGLVSIALGGHVFHLLVSLICAIMVWELVGMLRPGVKHEQLQLGALTGVAVFAAIYLPVIVALVLLLVPVLVGQSLLTNNRRIYAAFTLVILLTGYSLMQVRDDLGFGWMLWLVLVVVATDVAGYFAGRMIGGPKLWPAVSPKKTWSGTVAGWIGAAIVGLLFSINTGIWLQLVCVSIVLSMASQIGDIAESALKRKMGVKDSSSLIPGHGGLMDRFDGMLGAAVLLLVIGQLVGFPPGLN